MSPRLRSIVYRPTRTTVQGFAGNSEPDFAEMLQDPVIRAVMDSDGVTHEQVANLVGHVRAAMGWIPKRQPTILLN